MHRDILKDRIPIEEKYQGGCQADPETKTFLTTGESFPPEDPNTYSQLRTDESTSVSKKSNPNVIVAYDIQVQDWRSFRIDSVKSIGVPNTIHTDSGTVYPTITGKASEPFPHLPISHEAKSALP